MAQRQRIFSHHFKLAQTRYGILLSGLFATSYIAVQHHFTLPLLAGIIYFYLPFGLLYHGLRHYFSINSKERAKPALRRASRQLIILISVINLPFLIYFFITVSGLSRVFLGSILVITVAMQTPVFNLIHRRLFDGLSYCGLVVLIFCFGIAFGHGNKYFPAQIVILSLWTYGSYLIFAISRLGQDQSSQQNSTARWLGLKNTTYLSFWCYILSAVISLVFLEPFGIVMAVLLSSFWLNAAFFLKYKSDARYHLFARAWRNIIGLTYIMGFWLIVLLISTSNIFGFGISNLTITAQVLIGFSILQTILIIHNVLGFRRPASHYHDDYPRVSILIHAFNQADNISSTLLAALGQNYPDYEILFTDLGSDDATAQIAQNFQDKKLKITRIAPPPDTWNINSWASQELLKQASGEVIVVLLADTILLPDALGKMVGLMIEHKIDVLSLLPADQNKTVAQKMLLTMNRYFLMALYPAAYLNKNLPRYSLAYSGVMIFASHALDDIDGFSLVKKSPLEDLEIASAAKQAGKSTAFYLGSELAIMQNHASLRLITLQNLQRYYPTMRYSYPLAVAALSLGFYVLCLPFILLLVSLALHQHHSAFLLLVGIVMAIINRLIIAITSRQSYLAALFYPLTSFVSLCFLFASVLQYELLKPRWQNRTEL